MKKWAAGIASLIAAITLLWLPSVFSASEPSRASAESWKTLIGFAAAWTEEQTIIIEHASPYDVENRTGKWFSEDEVRAANTAGVQLSARITGRCERCQWLIVRLETDSHTGIDALERWIALVEERLAEKNMEPSWTIEVSGLLADAANSEQLWSELEQRMQAKKSGAYADYASVSRSYYSSLLPHKFAHDQHSNLQAALHRDTESGGRRLTLASPAISSEF